MPQITVTDLRKTYRIAERRPGLGGAIPGLVPGRHRDTVPLDAFPFSVEPGTLGGSTGPTGAGSPMWLTLPGSVTSTAAVLGG